MGRKAIAAQLTFAQWTMKGTIEFKDGSGATIGEVIIDGGKAVMRGDPEKINALAAFIPKRKARKLLSQR